MQDIYHTPDTMKRATIEVMSKISYFDKTEGTFVIFCPMPSRVEITLQEGDDFLDLCLELHEVLEQNGVEYSLTSIDGKQFVVLGLH
jgi:hypothetical protein